MKDFGRVSDPQEETGDNNRSHSKLVWGMFLIVCLGLGVLVAVNLLGYHSSQITKAKYQVLSQEFKTPGLLLRQEEVIFASQAGEVDLKVPEGKRVSAGNQIVTIQNEGDKDELYNYQPGIVSYKVDGLEATLSPKNRADLSYQQFKELAGKTTQIKPQEKVNIGRPLFKIVDNFKIYLAVLLPQKELSNYEVDTEVEVKFTDLDLHSFAAKIDLILTDKPQNVMIIELNKFSRQLIDQRRTQVRVIKKEYTGIVVPEAALVKNSKGDLGVWVQGYVKTYFSQVDVKARIDGQAVVKGVLPGARVVLN
ncbi:HlyD family efflux transporter periplasmic adaptor subunit [Halanaerobaculum tunisiense]